MEVLFAASSIQALHVIDVLNNLFRCTVLRRELPDQRLESAQASLYRRTSRQDVKGPIHRSPKSNRRSYTLALVGMYTAQRNPASKDQGPRTVHPKTPPSFFSFNSQPRSFIFHYVPQGYLIYPALSNLYLFVWGLPVFPQDHHQSGDERMSGFMTALASASSPPTPDPPSATPAQRGRTPWNSEGILL